MFERYTERARRVLFFARYEATQLGSLAIESEHILLGLVREGKGLTSRLFARRHVSLEHIRREIESRVTYREKVSASVEIPFSPDSRSILQYAAEEADRLGHNYIGTEHLLLGILRAERSAAASILTGFGFALQSVRDEIVQLLSEKPVHPSDGTGHAASSAPAGTGYVYATAGGPPHAPAYVPSEIVHISFTTHVKPGVWFSESPRHWHVTGADLRALIARAYRIEDARVDLAADVADGRRYDVVLLLPQEEDAVAVARRVQQAIEHQFNVRVVRETRADGDVVAVTRASESEDR